MNGLLRMYELDVVSEEVTAFLPPSIREGIDMFVWYGIPTGDFLRAVLTNDLIGAVGRADDDSLAAIRPICQYVYNAVPGLIHGSAEKVDWHIKRGREIRDIREEEIT